jgi:UrcA family protein
MHTQSPIANHTRRRATMFIAGVALCSLATLSVARSYDPLFSGADAPLQVTVHFADLDVTRPEGAAVLYRRIRSAAREVCFPIQSLGYYSMQQAEACMDKAITDAVNTVDRPALFAVFSTKRAPSPAAPLESQNR